MFGEELPPPSLMLARQLRRGDVVKALGRVLVSRVDDETARFKVAPSGEWIELDPEHPVWVHRHDYSMPRGAA